MSRQVKKENIFKRISNIIIHHVNNNIKEYMISILVLFIGVFIGIIIINNIEQEKQRIVEEYIYKFIQDLKTDYNINKIELLKQSLKGNIIMALIIWFAGSTIIGLPLIYLVLVYKGFSIGYTISSLIATLGTIKGAIISVTSLMLQNLFYIPILLVLVVSGLKVCKVIIKDKQIRSFKNEIIRHTIISMGLIMLLCISSFIETYLSANFLEIIVKFI